MEPMRIVGTACHLLQQVAEAVRICCSFNIRQTFITKTLNAVWTKPYFLFNLSKTSLIISPYELGERPKWPLFPNVWKIRLMTGERGPTYPIVLVELSIDGWVKAQFQVTNEQVVNVLRND